MYGRNGVRARKILNLFRKQRQRSKEAATKEVNLSRTFREWKGENPGTMHCAVRRVDTFRQRCANLMESQGDRIVGGLEARASSVFIESIFQRRRIAIRCCCCYSSSFDCSTSFRMTHFIGESQISHVFQRKPFCWQLLGKFVFFSPFRHCLFVSNSIQAKVDWRISGEMRNWKEKRISVSQVAASASQSNHTHTHMPLKTVDLGGTFLFSFIFVGFLRREQIMISITHGIICSSRRMKIKEKTKQKRKIAFAPSTATDADEMLVRI